MKKTRQRPRAEKEMTADDFIALPDEEKERIWQEIDRTPPEQLLAESRPLNAKERKLWQKFKRKVGRPKIGKGVKVISVGVERELLKKADNAAKRRGLNRSAMVSEALRAFISSAA